MSQTKDETEVTLPVKDVSSILQEGFFSPRNIIEKDIAFIRKSIEILDTADPSIAWHKNCFSQHVQIHLEVLHDYHFGEQQMKMYYQARQEDNMFLSADQKIIIIYMEALRKLQNLLSTTESRDLETAEAMESLKDILTQYEEFLLSDTPKTSQSEPISPKLQPETLPSISTTIPSSSQSKIKSNSTHQHVNNSVSNIPDIWKVNSLSASRDHTSAVLKVLSEEELSPTSAKRRSKRELCVEVSISESVDNQENSHHLHANSVNNTSPYVSNISRCASTSSTDRSGTTPNQKKLSSKVTPAVQFTLSRLGSRQETLPAVFFSHCGGRFLSH